jgi:hypothetical protein
VSCTSVTISSMYDPDITIGIKGTGIIYCHHFKET